jgi:glycosyltransferase involved in cell wall biosynthesis
MKIDVIVCTKNPKPEYFESVLEAIANQSLSRRFWNLHIVDNGSCPAVQDCLSESFKEIISQVIIEPQAGLTRARLAGIQNTQEEIIVFVDDDNILDANYLERVLEIGGSWPILGTWGGQISGRFEEAPSHWNKQFLNWIAVRTFEQDSWSNVHFDAATHPYGAGMCVRRRVAQAYLQLVQNDLRHVGLDRKGNQLWGGGDADMAYTSTSLGLGNGVFTNLHLTHIIPSMRLQEGYLLKLVEDMTCSHHVLNFLWGKPVPHSSRSQALLKRYQLLFCNKRDRRFEEAKQKGLKKAQELVSQPEFASV